MSLDEFSLNSNLNAISKAAENNPEVTKVINSSHYFKDVSKMINSHPHVDALQQFQINLAAIKGDLGILMRRIWEKELRL